MSDFIHKLLFLPQQASTVSPHVDELHYWVIGITMVGWAVLTLTGTYFVIRYRRRHGIFVKGDYKPPLSLELAIIGALLGLFIVFWVWGFRVFVELREPPADATDVYVTAKQWMWKFAHADGRSAVSVLTVPAGRPIRLLMTSRDVIHSFYVPEFRIKQDVLPGRYTVAWFEATHPGTYQILCTEYCGLQHSNMRGSVVALAPAEYDRWLQQTRGDEHRTGGGIGLAEEGHAAALRFGCFACHTIDGRPPIGPTWKDLFQRETLFTSGEKLAADEAYVTESIMDPRARIVAGFNPVMPSYQGLIEPGETAAIIEYIKSLRFTAPAAVIPPWNGNVPEVVQ